MECRLCGSTNRKTLIDVFDSRFSNGATVKTYILLSTGVEIKSSDHVSTKICSSCVRMALSTYVFRTKAMKTDRYLRMKIGGGSVDDSPLGITIDKIVADNKMVMDEFTKNCNETSKDIVLNGKTYRLDLDPKVALNVNENIEYLQETLKKKNDLIAELQATTRSMQNEARRKRKKRYFSSDTDDESSEDEVPVVVVKKSRYTAALRDSTKRASSCRNYEEHPLDDVVQQLEPEMMYECPECGICFETEMLLFKHSKQHNFCEHCNLTFQFPSALKAHLLRCKVLFPKTMKLQLVRCDTDPGIRNKYSSAFTSETNDDHLIHKMFDKRNQLSKITIKNNTIMFPNLYQDLKRKNVPVDLIVSKRIDAGFLNNYKEITPVSFSYKYIPKTTISPRSTGQVPKLSIIKDALQSNFNTSLKGLVNSTQPEKPKINFTKKIAKVMVPVCVDSTEEEDVAFTNQNYIPQAKQSLSKTQPNSDISIFEEDVLVSNALKKAKKQDGIVLNGMKKVPVPQQPSEEKKDSLRVYRPCAKKKTAVPIVPKIQAYPPQQTVITKTMPNIVKRANVTNPAVSLIDHEAKIINKYFGNAKPGQFFSIQSDKQPANQLYTLPNQQVYSAANDQNASPVYNVPNATYVPSATANTSNFNTINYNNTQNYQNANTYQQQQSQPQQSQVGYRPVNQQYVLADQSQLVQQDNVTTLPVYYITNSDSSSLMQTTPIIMQNM